MQTDVNIRNGGGEAGRNNDFQFTIIPWRSQTLQSCTVLILIDRTIMLYTSRRLNSENY